MTPKQYEDDPLLVVPCSDKCRVEICILRGTSHLVTLELSYEVIPLMLVQKIAVCTLVFYTCV